MRFLGGIWKRKVNGEILDYYPCPFMVGDIFITTNSIRPEIRYPGTSWEELPEETYLMIASSKFPVKSIGGENEHTLTIDEMPSHTHSSVVYGRQLSGDVIASSNGEGGSYPGKDYNIGKTGGGQSHNNMPQFYAIYGYRRIA